MKFNPRPPGKLVALTMAAILAPMLAASFILPALVAEPGGFRRVKAGRFAVQSRISPTYSATLAKTAEEFADVFINDLKKSLGKSALTRRSLRFPRRTFNIYYVRNMAELNEFYGVSLDGPLEYNDGFYDPRRGIIVLRHASDERFARDIKALRHELTHLLMDQLFRDGGYAAWSLWFAEGMAVYYEHEGDDMPIIKTVKGWIDSGEALPLERVIRAESADYRSGMNDRFYYQGYTLTLMLMTRYPEKFTTYLSLEGRMGTVGTETVYTVFEMSKEDLEREWRKFVRGL